MQAQTEAVVKLVCRITGRPFYPVRDGGRVCCSECGQPIWEPPAEPLQ